MNTLPNAELLRAALLGYTVRLQEIDDRIAEVKMRLRGRVYVLPHGQPCCPVHADQYDIRTCATCRDLTGQNERKPHKKHQMSAAGRRAVSAAQKKRWAAYRKAHQ